MHGFIIQARRHVFEFGPAIDRASAEARAGERTRGGGGFGGSAPRKF